MSLTKKEVILGAVVIAGVPWVAMGMLDTINAEAEILLPPITGTAGVVIGIALTLVALGSVILGIIGTRGSANPTSMAEAWNKKFTLKATIPGYFLLALVPVWASLILVTLTGQAFWATTLNCVSLPIIIMFLLMYLGRYSEFEK